ncbi:MAG: aspartate/glutamate racemase/prolyl-tRNA editing enzyme YbaK/EbsC (Cys-tRNA(Pro) deacylase) [Alteromonadaceae bacterium]|jgi:aspartate/glutamate racemase/prolyl-tRNA editing enzyme YbaK/EbsC (Cys-tRNA(Pro) deacylase)
MQASMGLITDAALAVMPAEVQQSLTFLEQYQVWHILSQNSAATSCRDAAARRQRLGMQGIPLYDELKSLCVVLYREDNSRYYCMLHSRANARINLTLVEKLLNASRPLARLSAEELSHEFGAKYGTVNPFFMPSHFIHVFDADILNQYTAPHTMMTNAGEHTWALEFEPAALINAVRQVSAETIVATIAERIGKDHKLPSFGIITGNGPESGMALWRYINETIRKQLSADGRLHGDLSYPKVLIHSLPEMGLSMELAQREDMVWQVIVNALEQLCNNGVTHIALACNTTPYFTKRIRAFCQPHGVEFISIAEATEHYIRQRQLDNITIIGIPAVAGLGDYSAYKSLAGLNIKAVSERVFSDLQEFGYLVKRLGDNEQDAKAMNKLQHIINAGVETPRVLIALTEISVFMQRFPKFKGRIKNREIIDPLPIYGECLAECYLQALPQEQELI